MSVVPWLLLDLVVALLVLAVIYQRRGQLFTLLRFRRMRGADPGPPLTARPRWLSTQPAPNPDRIPRWLAQRMGPFPMTPRGGDWNFFCYLHIAPGRPVRLRGKLPDCRLANLTLYAPEHLRAEKDELPASLDAEQIVVGSDGTYEIAIGHEETDVPNRLDPGGARHAMLALRHYVFDDGVDIPYPEVWWGDVLVMPARTVAGVRSVFPRGDRPRRPAEVGR